MPRPKKVIKAKEPVRIRFKELQNGNKSIYLDIYRNGKRTYEFLKLYIVPEIDPASRAMNQHNMALANKIKADRIIELTNSEREFQTPHCVGASSCLNCSTSMQDGWRTTVKNLPFVGSIPYGKRHSNSVAMFPSGCLTRIIAWLL